MQSAKIAIIGGSGVYAIEDLKNVEEVSVETPFGPPSDKIILGDIGSRRVAFLSRHGRGHIFPPHLVNYRANIYALKKLGVERIFAVNACGSLREDFVPGEIVILDQFIDCTKSRVSTFFEGKNKKLPVTSMPGAFQFSLDRLIIDVRETVKAGIPAVLVTDLGYFGVPEDLAGKATITALGIGPAKKSEVKRILKRFQVFKEPKEKVMH